MRREREELSSNELGPEKHGSGHLQLRAILPEKCKQIDFTVMAVSDRIWTISTVLTHII